MKKTSLCLYALLLLLPGIANAQVTILTLIEAFQSIIQALVPFIFGIAVIGVLWGLTQYLFKAGDEKAQSEGRKVIFWGIITLFVMVSLWSFVNILSSLFFGDTGPGTGPAGGIPTLNETPVPNQGGGDDGDAGGSLP